MENGILNRVNSPDDIKDLTDGELSSLASEIREYIEKTVAENGGHLASNLGVVELTLALHRCFDFKKDHLIFDVGHQCYAHKILTGRKDSFPTIRKRGGLSGFTKRSESGYDCFGAGHSSTSVSAAIGFAEADRVRGSDAWTVAVLGDGAFTGGMVHEALNNCRQDLRLIIVLNENEMSISKNIGSFAGLIAKLRASKGYYRTKRKTVEVIKKIPLIGDGMFRSIRGLKQAVKNKMYKSNYFEDLGLYYLGPIDGNDRVLVERLLSEAKNAGQSTVLHVRTVKGKGSTAAEADPGKYHSVSPAGKIAEPNFSSEAGKLLLEMARKNEKICAVTAAMAQGTGLTGFASELPGRFFDVGIAEEHALTFSAGLAANGMKPYFAVYSSFLQRGYDNLIHDIALQNLPVTVLVDRAGFAVGDGATHHGIFDVAFLSQIPNMEIFSPSCFESLKEALEYSETCGNPVAIRYPNKPDNALVADRFIYGGDTVRADFDTEKENIIITYGTAVTEAVKAAEKTDCGIILLEKLKPYRIAAEKIQGLLPKTVKRVIFVEEGIKNGGAGMIIRDELPLPENCTYKVLAVDDRFEPRTVTENIYADFGIDCESIVREFNI